MHTFKDEEGVFVWHTANVKVEKRETYALMIETTLKNIRSDIHAISREQARRSDSVKWENRSESIDRNSNSTPRNYSSNRNHSSHNKERTWRR